VLVSDFDIRAPRRIGFSASPRYLLPDATGVSANNFSSIWPIA
jgi:hypothetical protein